MRERAIKIARWLAYPLFYLFCLAMFGYLTFPFDRLKDRIITEFERHGKPGMRLEIEKLSSYWFTGVELYNAKVILPPDDSSSSPMGGMALPRSGDDLASAAAATAPKEATITIDEAHARVRILPLLIGRVRIDFWASAFGGEVSGTVPAGSSGDVDLALDKIDLGKVEPLVQMAGVPIKGIASGKLELSAVDGKFSKANGALDLSVEGIVIGDGKSKLAGLIELPAARLGTLTVAAEAKEGSLKINKLSATGTDLELVGDGRVSVREPWNDSNADLYIKFKFTDAYRNKNETTKSLLGEPGAALPGLIEIQVPKMKRAKRADGFYGWHMYGALKRLKFDPSSVDVAPSSGLPLGASSAKPRGKGSEWKRPSGLNLPPPAGNREEETPSQPTPPPPPRPAVTEEPAIKMMPDAPTPPPQREAPPERTPETAAPRPSAEAPAQ